SGTDGLHDSPLEGDGLPRTSDTAARKPGISGIAGGSSTGGGDVGGGFRPPSSALKPCGALPAGAEVVKIVDDGPARLPVITSASEISARIHPPDRSGVARKNRARLRGGARNRLRRLT